MEECTEKNEESGRRDWEERSDKGRTEDAQGLAYNTIARRARNKTDIVCTLGIYKQNAI